MQSTVRPRAEPEILSPRTKRGGKMFDDEHLDILSHVLDDFIAIPGTSIRFGSGRDSRAHPGNWGCAGWSCFVHYHRRGVGAGVCRRPCWRGWLRMLRSRLRWGRCRCWGTCSTLRGAQTGRNYALLTGSIYEPRKHTRQSWIFFSWVVRVSDGAGADSDAGAGVGYGACI